MHDSRAAAAWALSYVDRPGPGRCSIFEDADLGSLDVIARVLQSTALPR